MRSLCRWLIVVIVSACSAGCCPGPKLSADQTPVIVAQDARVKVRPYKGGDARRVTVPAGMAIVEPPPADWQPNK